MLSTFRGLSEQAECLKERVTFSNGLHSKTQEDKWSFLTLQLDGNHLSLGGLRYTPSLGSTTPRQTLNPSPSLTSLVGILGKRIIIFDMSFDCKAAPLVSHSTLILKAKGGDSLLRMKNLCAFQ